MELKYLFEAHFKDGSFIKQTPEDVSSIDQKRSRFYDVIQREDDLVAFALYNDQHVYLVDLRDGHFEIDGTPFLAQPIQTSKLIEGGKYKLIYWREHQQDLIMATKDSSITKGDHRHQYRFGWTYTDPKGSSFDQTIVIV